MEKDERFKRCEARVNYLEENRRYVQNALEMALSLGDFQEQINQVATPVQVLQEAEKRIQQLIGFKARAFYQVDPESSDFFLSFCEPAALVDQIEKEMGFMIEKGLVAWAMREKKGVVIRSKDYSTQILLHIISTSSRVKGMFVGVFVDLEDTVPDVSRDLISIIIRNTANALESIELRDQKRSEFERLQKEKLQGVIELAGAVCHEMNQPMQAVSGHADLLMLEVDPHDRLYARVATISEQVTRMGVITKKLMSITRYKTKGYLSGRIFDIDQAASKGDEKLPDHKNSGETTTTPL